jgi:CrcB protein
MSPFTLLAVAAGGGLGAVGRYGMVVLGHTWFGASPWLIAAVNVLGCFGFGLCWSLAHGRWSPAVEVAVLAGFFGAFTTFSAFAGDCYTLLAERRFGLLVGNVVLQNVLGIAGPWLGVVVGGGRS